MGDVLRICGQYRAILLALLSNYKSITIVSEEVISITAKVNCLGLTDLSLFGCGEKHAKTRTNCSYFGHSLSLPKKRNIAIFRVRFFKNLTLGRSNRDVENQKPKTFIFFWFSTSSHQSALKLESETKMFFFFEF